jgi:transposase
MAVAGSRSVPVFYPVVTSSDLLHMHTLMPGRSAMTDDLIDDDFWALIEPLLPSRPPRNRQHAGRRPSSDRAALSGIVYVLRTGIPWNLLPRELGTSSGAVCCRRWVTWQEAGVWDRIRETLLAELLRRGMPDVARTIAGGLSIRDMLAGNRAAGTLRPANIRAERERQDLASDR